MAKYALLDPAAAAAATAAAAAAVAGADASDQNGWNVGSCME